MKKYKALISDVDGTLIPNKSNGMISHRIRTSINRAKKVMPVSIATARALYESEYILNDVTFTGPLILCGGALIIDPVQKKSHREWTLTKEEIFEAIRIFKRFKQPINLDLREKNVIHTNESQEGTFFGVWANSLSQRQAEEAVFALSKIRTIAVAKGFSWTKGKFWVTVTHKQATKRHAVQEVASILGISPDEIIGVGDGHNDMSLLEACGLKIAMGNASDDIKAIADHVESSVEEDGMVEVIERFVL